MPNKLSGKYTKLFDAFGIAGLIGLDIKCNLNEKYIKYDLMNLQNYIYGTSLPKSYIKYYCNSIEHLIDFGWSSIIY